jgi:hypothetical protein
MTLTSPAATARRRCLIGLALLGLYLTVRGYESRDGDQAYRLPLLLARQTPELYANDPFVKAFDAFNPHAGYLAALDLASRPLGLSVALFALFAACFALTVDAFDRMARAVWPDRGPVVGLVAIGLVLTASAGNIGTNHLFESMLLDRLLALSLGWQAIAWAIIKPEVRSARWGAVFLGVAAVIHPSLGLQLGLAMIGYWSLFGLIAHRAGESIRPAIEAIVLLLVGLLPGAGPSIASSSTLFAGLAPDSFRALALFVQGPQHMVPHLWRWSQWMAAAMFPVLGFLSLRTGLDPDRSAPPARQRLLVLLVLVLVGLAASWVAIEPLGNLRAALFQPFRMATVARGLCLVLIAGRVEALAVRGGSWGAVRAGLLVAGLIGDLAFVVAVSTEIAASLGLLRGRRTAFVLWLGVLAAGLSYLVLHDPAAGQGPLLVGAAVGLLAERLARLPRLRRLSLSTARLSRLAVFAWVVPLACAVAPLLPSRCDGIKRVLIHHARFGAWPLDDVERLAAWARDHTPTDAVFITPPGPKTFRLWSLRSVAFNRAASPYHAEGLADWADRFRDHVGFAGTDPEFARAYLENRQAIESRYDALDDDSLAALARRQGASFVLARPRDLAPDSPLEHLKKDGRHAIYRVRP